MSDNKNKRLAAAINKLSRLEKEESFDAAVPGSRPNKKQLEFLKDIGTYKARVIRAGNRSGKGATAARELVWILNDNHPWWNRPVEWGHDGIQVIIAGQDRSNMEVEIWNKKLLPFLEPKDWRSVRQGQTLKMVENRKTGDQIIFLSHADSSEKNRRHMQGYTAQYVWLDEMPANARLLQEIRARAATNGYFVATFTPKFRSEEMRAAIDAVGPPTGKLYRFHMLDNPVFKGREGEVLAELDGYSQAYKDSVLTGDWFTGDSAVYEWLPETMIQAPPDTYSRAWRHVEAIDPALKSKCGFTLWAEDPYTGTWYLIEDKYIEGIYDPEKLYQKIQEQTKGYNLVRRISDTMAWYTGTAASHGTAYVTPYDKNSRKDSLIKGLQQALSSGKIKIAPWCTIFQDEIQGCQWSETSNQNRIVNSSSYHTLDSAQYFIDCMPVYTGEVPAGTWHEELRQGNQKRKKIEAAKKQASKSKTGRARVLSSWSPRKFNKVRARG